MGDTTVGIIGIIDDDRAVRRGLSRMLAAHGYAVEAYESAREFLQQEKLDVVDCLLVDVRMPDMTGFDLREQLASRGYTLPIVFITGDDDIVTAGATAGEPPIQVLVKPFDEDALLAAIGASRKGGQA